MNKLVNWIFGLAVAGFLVGLLLPAVQTNCRSSPRTRSASNLRQIGLGLMAYSNECHHFPPGATCAPDGSPLHGWPTLILPYIDNVELYKMIRLARPWDDPAATAPPSPSNREITGTRIDVYRNPRAADVPETIQATALGYATNAWVIGATRSMRLDQITDGASQTILAGEVNGDYKPWGNPTHWRDPGLGINKTPRGFGAPWDEGGANFVFADGSVRFLRDEIDRATLRALATPAGGEKQVALDDLE